MGINWKDSLIKEAHSKKKCAWKKMIARKWNCKYHDIIYNTLRNVL
jgi:hypothetical protein